MSIQLTFNLIFTFQKAHFHSFSSFFFTGTTNYGQISNRQTPNKNNNNKCPHMFVGLMLTHDNVPFVPIVGVSVRIIMFEMLDVK